ncbi:NAD(P)-dependent alcohol dehydrogenase protein [Mycena sanguinolenta]|uniref:NAD(P)-dependent alcohol dehydrogenase protein n=1 Tax=Mycena sanguinolenta TaxID=230812 RepID=A0A8H7DJE8_9AGAR|nr:NAD(P)-dependent alcohol dehydrogenase protein [Mycena sanguinolenta]
MSIEFTVFKGSANEGIVESKTRRDAPRGNEVLVKITHSGICGTDEHYKHADMVLGHEGVGTVEQIGDRVTQFKVGDVVGWGWNHKTCGECEQCLLGQDQYCPNREQYGTHNHHQGSFGSHAIWDASFLFKVPDSIAPEHAAPLMCGGATVFEVIEAYNIRPTQRVGVVGIGGLGHLAIHARRRCTLARRSSTSRKASSALTWPPLDHLMVTTSFLPDWKPFLSAMKPKGTIYPLTVSASDLVIPILPIVLAGINIQGTTVAARSVHKRMLDFAARNHIKPVIEEFPLTRSGVEEGMARLREGKIRYRGVLVAA